MNYGKIYNRIIELAQSRIPDGYVERHHIIPRCMGGTDEVSNLVSLSPEEHFLCHVLLIKMYPTEPNLIFAVQKMCRTYSETCNRPSRKLYGWLRRRFAKRMRELQSGCGNSQYGTVWITNGIVNKKQHAGAQIPSEWWRGRSIVYSEHVLEIIKQSSAGRVGSANSSSGTKYITDGQSNRRIRNIDHIPQGWRIGRTLRD